jgi:hypothetical protein
MSSLLKTIIYYLMIIVPSIGAGLYWAKNGALDRTSLYILIYYVIVVCIIRNLTVGVSLVDFTFNFKRKIERWKKIWTAQ